MSEGIPIPPARHPYYCSGCGDYHAPGNCPRFAAPAPLATAAEVAALREKINTLIGHGRAVDKETDMLRDVVNQLCSRLSALEAARKE